MVTGEDDFKEDQQDLSGSGWLFTCVLALVSKGLIDQHVFNLCFDRNHGISAHLYNPNHDHNPEKVLLKFIRDAKAKVDGTKGGLLQLNKDTPWVSAQLYVRDKHPHLRRYNEEWLTFDGHCYEAIEDNSFRSGLWHWMAGAVNTNNNPFQPKKGMVLDLESALAGLVDVPAASHEMPCWLSGHGPDPRYLLPCSNGLLNVRTGELLPPDPNLLNRNAFGLCL